MLISLFRPGEWISFPLVLLDIMDMADAVYLSFLISHQRRCSEDPREWVYLKKSSICAHLRVSNQQQKRHLRYLRELEVISQEMRGIPPKRYVRIEWRNLCDLLRVGWGHP